MEFLRGLIDLEPWSRFTAGLIAAMFVARGLDFLSTWIVTPKLELEANPLMRRAGFIRMALLNLPLLDLPSNPPCHTNPCRGGAGVWRDSLCVNSWRSARL